VTLVLITALRARDHRQQAEPDTASEGY